MPTLFLWWLRRYFWFYSYELRPIKRQKSAVN
jgi:hypothetical protein